MRIFVQVLVNTGDREHHDELPLVRAHVLGVHRDAVRARHRHHRRRLHASDRGVRDAVRHPRRPSPQAPRDGALRVRDARGLPDRGCALPRLAGIDPVDIGGAWFWVFSGIILLGAVVENIRSIALSTTVTLLVPVERHANANGMVGHRAGRGVHGDERVQRPRDRLPRDGVDARDRDRLHARRARAPASSSASPRTRPQATSGKRPLIDLRGSVRAVGRVPGCSRSSSSRP